MHDSSWKIIFDKHSIGDYDFSKSPFLISAQQIKEATKAFDKTSEKEVRILCKQDSRGDRPKVFIDNDLFILPVKNGEFVLVQGEGYVDIPLIETEAVLYSSNLDYTLKTSVIGSSEMQHLDYAYATSLIRTFMKDESLVLTIRGRKYTPQFSFRVGKHEISAKGVQTEVDAGYEGREQVVLIEAKNGRTDNTIIRQLYYPFRQWSTHSDKPVKTLFFEKRGRYYTLWHYEFSDINDYNSITLINSQRFEIITK